jgi:rubrerythrin
MTTEVTGGDTLPPPISASTWERELFELLSSHVEREREILQEYQAAAQETRSKAFAYVIGLLVDDEKRHHELFKSLAQTVRNEAELIPGSPVIPYMDFDRIDSEKIRRLSLELLRNEDEDAKELRKLHDRLNEVQHTTLWDLLVGLMRRDTDKHIAMLEFVLAHTPRGKW